MFAVLRKRFAERHKHNWEQISEVTVESLSERFQGGLRNFPNMGTWMYERKTITRLRCECGKTKRVILAHP